MAPCRKLRNRGLQRASGLLRRCSDADTSKQRLSRDKDASILSWPHNGGKEGARSEINLCYCYRTPHVILLPPRTQTVISSGHCHHLLRDLC
eukprot:scaffold24795_cov61-Skeletonema_dohrnii-CCMP3373.AAC.1